MTDDLLARHGLQSSYVPVVRPDALVRFYGNEGVAWSPAHSAAAYLDPVAATLVQVLDGEATVGDVVADVIAALGVPADLAVAQMARVVMMLREHALLADSSPEPSEPVGDIFHDPPNP